MKNLFLLVSIIILIGGAAFFAYSYNLYSRAIDYWGSDTMGNGYWLSPYNRHVDRVESIVAYQGDLIAIDNAQSGQVDAYDFHIQEKLSQRSQVIGDVIYVDTDTIFRLVKEVEPVTGAVVYPLTPLTIQQYINETFRQGLGDREVVCIARVMPAGLYPDYLCHLAVIYD